MRFIPRVLIVEDDGQMVGLLERVVTATGGTARTVTSRGWSADLVDREKFDAIFLGWRLGQSEALKIAEAIRFSETNSRCPIVLVTPEAREEAVDLYTRAGVKFFLHKPVSPDQAERVLAGAIALSLRQRSRSERVPVAVPVIGQWQLGCAQQRTQGHLLNLSSSGLLMRLDGCPPPQSLIELWFQLPGETQPSLLEARMVRLEPGMRVGVRFVNLTSEQEQRLINFVQRTLEESVQIPVLPAAEKGQWFPTFRRFAELFAR